MTKKKNQKIPLVLAAGILLIWLLAKSPGAPGSPGASGPKPSKPPRASGILRIRVDARGCSLDGINFLECNTLCQQDSLFVGITEVWVDITEGPHDRVVKLAACLRDRGLVVSTIRS